LLFKKGLAGARRSLRLLRTWGMAAHLAPQWAHLPLSTKTTSNADVGRVLVKELAKTGAPM
jgi:hypothetical protein